MSKQVKLNDFVVFLWGCVQCTAYAMNYLLFLIEKGGGNYHSYRSILGTKISCVAMCFHVSSASIIGILGAN